jgi:hypothetical protein
MKVTTVRFGSDLWALLESEAARAGVSVSQYVREAALARAAAAVAARGDAPFERLAGGVRELAADQPDAAMRRAAQDALAKLARLAAADAQSSAEGVTAESAQARRTARSRQERAAELARDADRLLHRRDR